MANESTLALVSALINPVWEGALWYAQRMFVMPRLVTFFGDRGDWVDRKQSIYKETGVQDNVAETADLDSYRYEFDRDAGVTLSPKEIGKQFLITDRRIRTDPESVMVDAASDIGYAIGKKVETDIITLFGSLIGGYYGDQTNSFSLDMLYKARARLEAAAIPAPYIAVLHPYHYLDIFNELVALGSPAPLDIRNAAMANYYVVRVADFTVVVSTSVPVTNVTNEVQTVTITGTPTGGNFTLTFAGQTTANIAYNANAAAVQAALEALPNIGTGGVVCAGGALPGTPVTVTFSGTALAGQDVPLMTANSAGLTGGTSPTVTPTETTKGRNYANSAMFSRDAMAYDLRQGLRIEPQRDASKRATELNATMVYGTGVWRSERGVQLRADASTPFN